MKKSKKTVSNTKKIQKKCNKIYEKIKAKTNKFISDPVEETKRCMAIIKKYIMGNKYFCLFVFINVLNSMLLRIFTMRQIFSISPFLADLSLLIILGAIGYYMNSKKRVTYYVVLSFIFMLICVINSCYYTYYTSFASISLISTTKFVFAVGDAVVESVVKLRDLIYVLFFGIMVFSFIKFSKTSSTKKPNKKTITRTFGTGIVLFIVFLLTLTTTDIGRLVKQWNREYIVGKYGIYIYQANDIVKSLEPKISSLFGYDEALKKFNEYFENKPNDKKTNEYTNKYKGKNIIGIHAESIQGFLIDLKINGKEVTPNINKLVKNGLYFDNFYSQVGVGTSSDTEFTLATSLMPANTGTAFGNHFDKTYIALPNILKEKGYYTFSMHANNADYWNRRVMYKTLGYERFYSMVDFDINETIGLGLSDSSFFKQAIEKLKVIDSENKNYYGTFIMLSNHTPFSDLEKYGEFDVSKTVNQVNYPYMENTKLGNYLKSAHYADKCLGEFFKALEQNNLLENTVIVLYGDHDARLPIEDFQRFYNYDIKTDDTLNEDDPKYVDFDYYSYELNRKVPLIIWSKDGNAKKVSTVMGMYDVLPTLGNMFDFENKYALGRDIFNNLKDNIVVFPSGNWLTNKVYYNSQKSKYLVLKESVISEKYIEEKNKYADDLLDVSNAIIVYDLIKNASIENVDESKVIGKK